VRKKIARSLLASVVLVGCTSLPLTTSEYIGWDNPSVKPAFDYMMQYSPGH
jgi:protease II